MPEKRVMVAGRVEDTVSVEGSIMSRCMTCRAWVWVAPSSLTQRYDSVLCLHCLARRDDWERILEMIYRAKVDGQNEEIEALVGHWSEADRQESLRRVADKIRAIREADP